MEKFNVFDWSQASHVDENQKQRFIRQGCAELIKAFPNQEALTEHLIKIDDSESGPVSFATGDLRIFISMTAWTKDGPEFYVEECKPTFSYGVK